MAFIITIEGKKKFLELAVKDTTPSPLYIRLFTNDTTPTVNSVITDFTQLTDHNYTSKTVAKNSWITGTVAETEHVTIESVNQVFVLDGTGVEQTVYGYYIIINDGTAKIIGAEKFPVGITVGSSGATITIKPKIQYN